MVEVRKQIRRPGSPRTVVHKVRVTAEQETRLATKAAERGVTISRLLVESALSGGADAAAAKAALGGEMFRLVRMLGAVGNNINQIAKATNATLEVQPATAHALDAHARVVGQLQRFLEDLDRGYKQ